MHVITFKGGFDNNFSYLIVSNQKALLIDPFNEKEILDYLIKDHINLGFIINTHSHFDHIDGNNYFLKNTSAKLIPLTNNKQINLNNIRIIFIRTPGHTSDSRCILINNKYLFTGDTLFVHTVGKTESEKDFQSLLLSLKKLYLLPNSTIIYPGHDYGPYPTSTIKKEKDLNPFFQLII